MRSRMPGLTSRFPPPLLLPPAPPRPGIPRQSIRGRGLGGVGRVLFPQRQLALQVGDLLLGLRDLLLSLRHLLLVVGDPPLVLRDLPLVLRDPPVGVGNLSVSFGDPLVAFDYLTLQFFQLSPQPLV